MTSRIDEARTANRRRARFNAALAGVALALVAFSTAAPTPASAQWFGFRYPLYAPAPVESEMSPREVREVLARFGYNRMSRPLYDDGLVIVEASNRFGDRERLILDAYTGHLLGRRAAPHRALAPPPERPRGPAISRVPDAPEPRAVVPREPTPRIAPAPRPPREATPPVERARPPTTVRREPMLPPPPQQDPRPRVTVPTPAPQPRTVTPPPAAVPAPPPAATAPAPGAAPGVAPGPGTREQPRRIELTPAPLDDAAPRPRAPSASQPPINSIPPAALE
jgi:hypothetical protein